MADFLAGLGPKEVMRHKSWWVGIFVVSLVAFHQTAAWGKGRPERIAARAHLKRAFRHHKAGALGAAHLYVRRALAIDENNRKAMRLKARIEKKLAGRTRLKMIVSEVAPIPMPHACPGLGAKLEVLLRKRGRLRTDLGGDIVDHPPEKGQPTASLTIEIPQCRASGGEGRATLKWSIRIPIGGKVLAGGVAGTELPKGIIPKEEQDVEGKNASARLLQKSAKRLLDVISEGGDDIAYWPLTLAEYAVAKKNRELAADAFAMLLSMPSPLYDPERAQAVEAYLDAAFE